MTDSECNSTNYSKPLTPKQQRAVLLISQGLTADEVATQLKMSPGTINNWRSQNERFRKQLEETQQEMFSSGVNQLKALVQAAAHTLFHVMDDPTAANRDKIAAARTVLQHCDRTVIETTQPIEGHEDVDDFLERMGLH